MSLQPLDSPVRKKGVTGPDALVSKEKKCWDVHANINKTQPILSYHHFPQGILLFICGVCPILMNALEPLMIFLCDFAEHLNQYFYFVCAKENILRSNRS